MFQTLGEIRYASVCAGWHEFRTAAFFSNAPPAALESALERYGLAGATVLNTPFHCLLIQIAGETVLVDTGIHTPPAGSLFDELAKLGVQPERVNTVILSHAHVDHIGGAVIARGGPAFPQARYVLARAEWESLHKLNLKRPENKIIKALDTQLDLIDAEIDLLPGLRLILTPGHTPGHLSVLVSSEDQHLLYTGDTFAHPLHLEHPDWNIVSDAQPTQAVRTRRWIFERARESGWQLFIYHSADPLITRLPSGG